MSLRLLPLVAATGIAAGCAVVPPTPTAPIDPGRGDDTCGAGAYQQYVGQRSPAITVPAGTVVRHYRTGDPVTMDFSASRINFEYSRTGTLVRVTCG